MYGDNNNLLLIILVIALLIFGYYCIRESHKDNEGTKINYGAEYVSPPDGQEEYNRGQEEYGYGQEGSGQGEFGLDRQDYGTDRGCPQEYETKLFEDAGALQPEPQGHHLGFGVGPGLYGSGRYSSEMIGN
ncbi:hypothetical protein OAG24_01255 [bacterium]|nr:hypothetical protein [bacterium]